MLIALFDLLLPEMPAQQPESVTLPLSHNHIHHQPSAARLDFNSSSMKLDWVLQPIEERTTNSRSIFYTKQITSNQNLNFLHRCWHQALVILALKHEHQPKIIGVNYVQHRNHHYDRTTVCPRRLVNEDTVKPSFEPHLVRSAPSLRRLWFFTARPPCLKLERASPRWVSRQVQK